MEAQNVFRTSTFKKKAKMSENMSGFGLQTCPSCNLQLDKSLLNSWGSMQCCPYCSAVISEEQVFSSEPGNASQTSLGMGSFQSRQEYLECQSKLRKNRLTVAQRRLKEDVTRYCEKLQLSKEIMEQVQDFLVERVFPDFKEITNKVRLVGACIYIISRNNDLIVTLKQVAVATGCTVFELGGVSKMMDKRYDLHRTPVTIESLISTACSDLPSAKECEELALQLCSRCSKSMVLVGSPLPQAIAYCVLASLAVNKGTTQKQEVTKLCLKMSQIAESTVLKCIRLLKNYMRTLLEAIPWVNMEQVKMSKIHYYIKDIVKFEQNCGGFTAKVSDPKWCQERENEINKRKLKIQNALKRIGERKCLTACETSMSSETMVNNEGNAASGVNNIVSLETTDADSITTDNDVTVESDVEITTENQLDEEDRLIEELLELGCSMEQLQEGFYDNLKTTSSAINHEIEESEIDSYVRRPEEVDSLKRVQNMDGSFDTGNEHAKRAKIS